MSLLRTIAHRVRLAFGGVPQATVDLAPPPPAAPQAGETTIRRQIGTKPGGTPIYVELRAGRLNGTMRQAGPQDDADDDP